MPITKPPVACPTSLPSPSARKACGKISASEYERLFVITTIGFVHLRSVARHEPFAAVTLLEERVFFARKVIQNLIVREAAAR